MAQQVTALFAQGYKPNVLNSILRTQIKVKGENQSHKAVLRILHGYSGLHTHRYTSYTHACVHT